MHDMPRPRKPYVQRERTRHGKTVWYFRRGDGPRIRLSGEYESPEWLADYEAAFSTNAKPAAKPAVDGTLRWLVERYKLSTAWANAAEATRRQRSSIFNRMLESGGNFRLSEVDRATIRDGMDRRRDTPAAAVCFVKAVRGLFRWAVEAGYVEDDPTAGIRAVDPQTEGHHTWTVDEVRKYQARHATGTMARLALDILLYTGMRRSDAVLFGRQHVRDGVITYRSVKTGIEVIAPLLAPLRASIEATDTGDLHFLVTEFGTPFKSSDSFGNWFRKRCIEAGVPGRAHGLRKAGATIAAENGASDRELMALFGWQTERQAGRYTQRADRARLARQAAEKLGTGTSIPAPVSSVPAPEKKIS